MIFSSCCAGHLVPFLLYNVFKGTASSCGERTGYRWSPTQALTSTHTGWARSCRRPASVAVAMGAFQASRLLLLYSDTRQCAQLLTRIAWDQPLVDAIKRQPETLGVHRPYQVDRVAEVERPARFTHMPVAFDSLWPLPRKINIIQYSSGEAPGGAPRPPLTPLALVRGFDVLPAMVVMRVDHSLKPRFLATDDVARCVRRRELRLSPFAFGPAVADDRIAMEAAVRRQLVRLDKYRHAYGFALPEDAAQGA